MIRGLWACLVTLLVLGCDRCPSSQDHPVTPTSPPTSQDPVLATVDGEPLALSWVVARLHAHTQQDAQTKAVALAEAAADLICLREFAVLGHHPKPGEPVHVAVDRMLAGTWRTDAGCPVDIDILRDAYRASISRWRHPLSLTLWEARFNCCEDGCEPAKRSVCQQQVTQEAVRLHRALQAALPPPTAATRTTLAASPAKRAHVPAFESVLAGPPWAGRWQLLRYTAFARDQRSARAPYRRTDPQLQSKAKSVAIGTLLEPVASAWGWSVALVVAREPARWSTLEDVDVQTALRAEICERRALSARSGYRARMLGKAVLRWQPAAIEAALGVGVLQLLPKPPEPPHLPKSSR